MFFYKILINMTFKSAWSLLVISYIGHEKQSQMTIIAKPLSVSKDLL